MISFITGESILLEEDFRLNGPIPLEWSRQYRTQVEVDGLLGKTWHTFADQTLQFKRSEGTFVWLNSNGNLTGLPYLEIGDEAVIATEKIKYTHLEDGVVIEDYDQKLSYHFAFVGGAKDVHRVTKISRHRFEIQFSYNASGRLEKVVDSSNRTLAIERDTEQRIISVTHVSETENDRTLVEYEYNEEGFLSVVRDTIGQEEKLEYTNGLLTLKTDRNGATEHWEFENVKENAKCLKHWFNKNGQQLRSFQYKLGNTVVTDAMGAKTTHWHRNGELIQVTDPMGNSESWEYNLNGMVMRYTDKMGQHTYYGYDDYGNKTSDRLPNGGSTNFVYEDNNLVAAKNATGALWLWKYDENGFLIRRIGPSNDTTRYFYKDDLLSMIIDPNGLETELFYNKEYTLEKVLLPNGEETNWKYDGQGQLINAVSSQDTSVNYQYDELGRVRQVKTLDGNMVHLKYDGVGNVLEAKDKHSNVRFEYSPTGKLESREENDTKIKFAYTKADQLKAITNEHKSLYRFDRDRNGQIIQESGFDGVKRKYQRNAGGQISQMISPDGKKVKYTYDLLSKVSIVTYDDQSKEIYTYDKGGAVIEAVNENGVVSFERDDTGKVIAESQNGIRIESAYNKSGERTTLKSSLGADIRISRNKFGQILNTTAEQKVDDEVNSWEVDFTRNLLGLEIERSLPGEVTSSWERDKSGRPVKHSVSAKEQLQNNKRYKWDVNDRLRSIEDLLKNEMISFEHDLFGNLSAAQYSDGSWDYKLPDEIGNLFKSKDKKDRQYGRAGQLLKDEKYTYSYNEVGNLIEKESINEKWKYKWTQAGMLKTVIRPDKKEVNFTYDPLGRRLTKTYQDQTTHFVWDGDVPLHEWTSAIDESNSVVNDKGEKEFKTPENLTTWIFEDGTFIPMAKIQGDKSYSIITDHLGTPTEAYDEEGKKVWSRQLNIYGETRNQTGFENFIPYLYQGQYYDVETELAYNRFRYYSPELGIYISQDPIGLEGGMPNMHSYVGDLNTWVDPFGLYNGEGTRDLNAYNSFHNHTLSPDEYKMSDATHFSKANESLHNNFQRNPEFAAKMEKKYPGITNHVAPTRTGAHRGTAPKGTTWHHATSSQYGKKGGLQLVDMKDHGKFHKIYHPEGIGGRNQWGGGTACR